MIDFKPTSRRFLHFFPFWSNLLRFVFRFHFLAGAIRVAICVDEIKASEEGTWTSFCIVGDNELNQLWPYLKIAVLVSIGATFRSVDLISKRYHLIQSPHKVRCIVAIWSEGKSKVIFEEKVVIIVLPVVYLAYKWPNTLACSSKRALGVF